tara:strand:+ start:984 stop:1370 length:387 start_codon:yes stop_codon:yes gene_type:complete
MARILGSPKTGGRQKGTKNKPSMKELAAQLAADGETPLEFMIRTMRTPMPNKVRGEEEVHYLLRCKEHIAIQQDMAKAAAPYMHPRLQTTTIAGDEEAPLKVAVDLTEGARRIAFALSKAAYLADKEK